MESTKEPGFFDESVLFRFADVAPYGKPFPHFEAADFLDAQSADRLLIWLEKVQWQASQLDGYPGYSDILLQADAMPARLRFLVAQQSLSFLRSQMARIFGMQPEGYVKVAAHRLVSGSSLKPHCDTALVRFTHRLLIQVNRGWTRENGGLLCLFDGDPGKKNGRRTKMVVPVHRSGFAFEISRKSFHSVTPVVNGERYTLTYTFYPPRAIKSN